MAVPGLVLSASNSSRTRNPVRHSRNKLLRQLVSSKRQPQFVSNKQHRPLPRLVSGKQHGPQPQLVSSEQHKRQPRPVSSKQHRPQPQLVSRKQHKRYKRQPPLASNSRRRKR